MAHNGSDEKIQCNQMSGFNSRCFFKKALVVLFAAGVFFGCAKPAPHSKSFVPALIVTGDVYTELRIDSQSLKNYAWTQVQNNDDAPDKQKRLPAIMLAGIIKKAEPRSIVYDILFVGSDGLASKIPGEGIEKCAVAFSEVNGWEMIVPDHPISARVKLLSKIIVINAAHDEKSPYFDARVRLEGREHADSRAVGFVDSKGTRQLSPGEAFLGAYTFVNEFEGSSTKNDKQVTVYTPHSRLGAAFDPPAAVVSFTGEMRYERGQGPRSDVEGKAEIRGNRMDFAFSDGTSMRDICGVLSNAPSLSIASVYEDSAYLLERGIKVLVIELDGWGWQMAEEAAHNGSSPFLSSQKRLRALVTYPPISPVNLATMVTGKFPNVHGIHDRRSREIAPGVIDIFQAAREMGKKALYVEGDGALIKTSVTPALSPDLGGESGTDDEVFANALSAFSENPDFLFVHFHGIDDSAHTFGPYAPRTVQKIFQVDGYVKSLVERWHGKIIITSDHGLHDARHPTALGAHGIFCGEDMIVPYILRDGGLGF
jgi:hypothetical protein